MINNDHNIPISIVVYAGEKKVYSQVSEKKNFSLQIYQKL
jgi:uncharacterized protein (DUF302 family)